ncbi:hypothetical protein ACWIID_28150 [Streptomyces phaeochromogenes]
MTIQRMDNIFIVVDDLDAVVASRAPNEPSRHPLIHPGIPAWKLRRTTGHVRDRDLGTGPGSRAGAWVSCPFDDLG